MTLTATPDPTYSPPRVRVDLTTNGIMRDAMLYRRQGALPREPVRRQPSPGFNQRTVYDYEPPYGVPVTYEWDGSYYDSNAITNVFIENWANTSSWTVIGPTGAWYTNANILRYGSTDLATAAIRRSLTAGRAYRITFAAPPTGVDHIDFGTFAIGVVTSRLYAGGRSVGFDPGTGSWVIVANATAATLTTTAGTYSVPITGYASQVSIEAPSTTYQSTYWSKMPTPATQFANATRMCVDPSGNVYVLSVLDNGTNFTTTVSVYTSAGVFVRRLTFTTGTAAGQTSLPVGIAADGTYVYLTDVGLNAAGPQRLTKFNATTGAYVAEVRGTGTGNGQFTQQVGAVVYQPAGNNILVGDRARVQIFSVALAYQAQIGGTQGTNDGQFASVITGIDVDSYGRVFVTDSDRLQVFNSSGAWQYTFPKGDTGSALRYPIGVSVSSIGEVFVTSGDSRTGRIVRYEAGAPGTTPRYIGELVDAIAKNPSAPNNVSLATIASTGYTRYLYIADPTANTVRALQSVVVGIPAVTVEALGAVFTVTAEASPAVQVDPSPSQAWLVHPGTPALSVPVSYDSLDATTLGDLGAATERATSTTHAILGQRRAIPVTSGPRAGAELALTLLTESAADRKRVQGVTADGTALLIRVPPGWALDFDDGFYSVGDVQYARQVQVYGIPARAIVLPLVEVDSPEVQVTESGWSWAAVAAEFSTWKADAAAFATWGDLLTNTRRPGY